MFTVDRLQKRYPLIVVDLTPEQRKRAQDLLERQRQRRAAAEKRHQAFLRREQVQNSQPQSRPQSPSPN